MKNIHWKKGIAILLILLSLPLIFHNQLKDVVYQKHNEKLLSAIENQETEFDQNLLEKLYVKGDPALSLSGVNGTLHIPSIDLKEPIFTGANEEHLRNGVALVGEDSHMNQNNIAIAGHNMQSNALFGRLNEVDVDDEIFIENGQEKVSFIITEKTKVDPDDTSVLEETDEKVITLITCTTYNWQTNQSEQRLILKGNVNHNE